MKKQNPYEPPNLPEEHDDRYQLPDVFFQECFAWFVLLSAILYWMDYTLDIVIEIVRKVSE